MRIWAKSLDKILCKNHLVSEWRESLCVFSTIVNNKKGYSNHPAMIEWKLCPDKLWDRMKLIREEMLRRGYHPKELPPRPADTIFMPIPWQSLSEQIERLKEKRQTIKSCKCKI
jgi:hypothetical protein